MVATTTQFTRSVDSSISYVSPATVAQVMVGPLPGPVGRVSIGLNGTFEINRPLVDSTAWMVKVTLLPVPLGTPRNQLPLMGVSNWFVRMTICSLLVPGLTLDMKKGGVHGNWFKSRVRSTLPFRP